MSRTRSIVLLCFALAFDAAVMTVTAVTALVDRTPNYSVLLVVLMLANVFLVGSLLLAITSKRT